MTTKEELALALLVYKAWRQQSRWQKMRGKLTTNPNLTATANFEIANHILELAKDIGVKKEFFDLLCFLPDMKITCEELSSWGFRPGCLELPENFPPVSEPTEIKQKKLSRRVSRPKKNTKSS